MGTALESREETLQRALRKITREEIIPHCTKYNSRSTKARGKIIDKALTILFRNTDLLTNLKNEQRGFCIAKQLFRAQKHNVVS